MTRGQQIFQLSLQIFGETLAAVIFAKTTATFYVKLVSLTAVNTEQNTECELIQSWSLIQRNYYFLSV